MKLSNPDYDMEFIMQKIADESPTFRQIIERMVEDTDAEYPTNEAWLGTLGSGKNATQIKLTVSQEPKHFIDEDDL